MSGGKAGIAASGTAAHNQKHRPVLCFRASLLSRVRLSSPHGHPHCRSCGVVIFSKWQTMAQDRISLVDHLDGLIFLADQARQLPPGRCVYLAHTFRRLGQAYQDAALAQREGWPVRLHITYKYILK
jgi:hypothetical protein